MRQIASPAKTIREMSVSERRRKSLETRVFRSTLLSSILLGAIALLVGLGIYAYTLSQQLIEQSSKTAYSAYLAVKHNIEAEPFAKEVMGLYEGLSEEERSLAGTEEYTALFSEVKNTEAFKRAKGVLWSYANAANADNVYLAMYDRERSRMVYIVDPDENPETLCEPGYWESVDRKGMERFLSWDGSGILYDIGNTENFGWICTTGYPFRDEAGAPYAFVLVDVTLNELIQGMRHFVFLFSAAVLVVTALIALNQTRRMKEGVIKPINAIAGAAREYMSDKKEGNLGTHRFAGLNIRTGDEIENLSLAMADMEHDLIAYIDDLTNVTAEKERIATELNMAANIQAHMLPNTFPPFPDRPEFEIYATMTPAKEVGGDFYDFFMVDSDHLAMVMADVSGKGVPAALFMMTSRTMLKDAALSGMDPAHVLERVNAQLCENNPDYMFVTVWLGILEISSGKLTWADAGHEQLLLYQDGAWKLLPRGGGIALAVFEPELIELEPEPPFHNHELLLKPGDALFQYTDGVTEAMTEDRRQFGYDRLLEAVNSASKAEPEALLPHIRAAIDAFVAGAPQFDDITMLSMLYRGAERNGDHAGGGAPLPKDTTGNT